MELSEIDKNEGSFERAGRAIDELIKKNELTDEQYKRHKLLCSAATIYAYPERRTYLYEHEFIKLTDRHPVTLEKLDEE